MESQTSRRINLKVEPGLHARLKAEAAFCRKPLQALVEDWLEEKVRQAETQRRSGESS